MSAPTPAQGTSSDYTALSDRLGLLLVVRIFMAGAVILTSLALPQLTLNKHVVLAAGAYAGLAIVWELLHRLMTRLTDRRLLFMVNTMLLVDGLYVAYVL